MFYRENIPSGISLGGVVAFGHRELLFLKGLFDNIIIVLNIFTVLHERST